MIALAEDLANEIAYAMALKEDQCGFVGDGTSTYGGIVGVVNAVEAGSIKGAATGNDSFETLDLADFEGAVGKLPEYAEGNAKWYISKAGYWASMARLMNAAGGNTTETLADGTRQKMFLGYPVITSQVMNSTLGTDASAPKAIIGDLRQGATVGDRRGFTLATSEHNDFESDQIAIRGNQRFDINVHERGTGTAAGALVLVKSAA